MVYFPSLWSQVEIWILSEHKSIISVLTVKFKSIHTYYQRNTAWDIISLSQDRPGAIDQNVTRESHCQFGDDQIELGCTWKLILYYKHADAHMPIAMNGVEVFLPKR